MEEAIGWVKKKNKHTNKTTTKNYCRVLSGIPVVPAHEKTPKRLTFWAGPWNLPGGIERSQCLRVEIKDQILCNRFSCRFA